LHNFLHKSDYRTSGPAMILPLGPMGGMQDEAGEPPLEVQEKHSYGWWCLFVLFVGLFLVQILAVDVFGALFTGIMASVVWFMVSNHCAQMSQYCLFLFGLMCGIQAIFEMLSLTTLAGGRKMQHTTASAPSRDGKTTSVTYTTVVETHPFFDSDMGFQYNIQSAAKIYSPLVMGLGFALAYWSYHAYPGNLFSASDDELGPMLGERRVGGGGRLGGGAGGGRDYGGPGVSLGGGSRGSPGQGSGSGAAPYPPTNQPPVFQGTGQRLGD